MTTRPFWNRVQEDTEADRRSCLTCFHLITRDSAKRAVCDVRPRVHCFVANGSGETFAKQSLRRAKDCKQYDGVLMVTLSHKGTTLTKEAILQDVTCMEEPDPGWSYTDHAGHLFRWEPYTDGFGNPWHRVPNTLKYVVDSPAVGDYPEIGHRECRLCGETVEMGWRFNQYRQYAITGYCYYVNSELVSEDEFMVVYERVRNEES